MKLNIIKEVVKTWYEDKRGFSFINPRIKDGLKPVNETAVVVESDRQYMMYFNRIGSGGPIISGQVLSEVEAKFDKALAAGLVVKSMLSFPEVRAKLMKEVEEKQKL